MMKRDEAEDIVVDLIYLVREVDSDRNYGRRYQKDLDEQRERVINLLMQTTEKQDDAVSVGDENSGIVPDPS